MDFFTLICWRSCFACLFEKTKNKLKSGREWPIVKKEWLNERGVDFSFERKTSLDKIVKRFKKVSKYEGQFSLTNILTFSRLPSLPPSLPPSLSLSYKYSLSLSFKYSFSLMYLHMHVLSLSPSLFHSNNHSFGLKYVPLSLSLSPSYICPLSLPLSDTSTISFTHSFSLSFIHMSSLSPSIIQMPSFSLSFVLSIIRTYLLSANHTWALSLLLSFNLSKSQNR